MSDLKQQWAKNPKMEKNFSPFYFASPKIIEVETDRQTDRQIL